jgi:hypothetical protein
MRPTLIATDQRILHQYLQDLICQANTVEEVDIYRQTHYGSFTANLGADFVTPQHGVEFLL